MATKSQIEHYVDSLISSERFDDEAGMYYWDVGPGRVQTGICTNGAKLVAKKFGGEVYGYHLSQSDTEKVAHDCLGHDFALVDGRFLVDWWGANVEGSSKAVYDLLDRDDATEVSKLYLPRELWVRVEDLTLVAESAVSIDDMASPQNPLDHKLPKNDLAGKGANAKGKQRFRANPLPGFGKGRDVRCANKLAFPAGRHSLVFRSMLDGVKLIEAIDGGIRLNFRNLKRGMTPEIGTLIATPDGPQAFEDSWEDDGKVFVATADGTYVAGPGGLVATSMPMGEGDEDAMDMRQSAVALAKRWGGVEKAKGDPEFQRLIREMSKAVHGDTFHTAAILADLRQDLLSAPPVTETRYSGDRYAARGRSVYDNETNRQIGPFLDSPEAAKAKAAEWNKKSKPSALHTLRHGDQGYDTPPRGNWNSNEPTQFRFSQGKIGEAAVEDQQLEDAEAR